MNVNTSKYLTVPNFALTKPKAIIAVTGKNPACGLDPFPMFEDGNFSVPSAYVTMFAYRGIPCIAVTSSPDLSSLLLLNSIHSLILVKSKVIYFFCLF